MKVFLIADRDPELAPDASQFVKRDRRRVPADLGGLLPTRTAAR